VNRIAHVVVEDLFGYARHEVEVRPVEPTILTAPNGAGKTHVLMLLRAALSLDAKSLFDIPFGKLKIVFTDARELVITRESGSESPSILRLEVRKGRRSLGEVAVFSELELEEADAELPSFIRPLPSGRYHDMRTDQILTKADLERRYRRRFRDAFAKRLSEYPHLRELVQEPKPIMIDTKRLDAVVPQSARPNPDTFRPGDSTVGSSSIGKYLEQIRVQIGEARRRSIQATQSADLSFAARALAAANQTVKEDPLHQRYDAIVERYEDLARNGLTVGEAPLDFPEKTTPTVRRILSVFLDDWEKRLEPLMPLNKKLNTLREILDTKLEHSGKRTAIASRDGLRFETYTRRPIRVSSLSSGEQHLVALFTLLLFTAAEGSIVLIDEPEISLHAAWKHAFLDDISRVAALADLQVILATHSTAIINGRWDLTEELSFSTVPQAEDEDDIEVEFETEYVLG